MTARFRSSYFFATVAAVAIAASVFSIYAGRPAVAVTAAGAGFVTWFGFVGVRLAR